MKNNLLYIFWIISSILLMNYFLSVVGLILRSNSNSELLNSIMIDLLFWQAAILVLYVLAIYYSLKILKRRELSLRGSRYLNFLLWIFVILILLTAPHRFGFESYRSFAIEKSVLPEYSILLVILILNFSQESFYKVEKFLMVFVAIAFVVLGYRIAALYYLIVLLSSLSIKNTLVMLAAAFFFLVYTQAARMGVLHFGLEEMLYVLTINAYDTLFSSARIILVNSSCSFQYDFLLNYLSQILPLPSSINHPTYLQQIRACTSIPGGGLFFSYLYFLLGFEAENGIPFLSGILAISFFIVLIYILFFLLTHAPAGLAFVAMVFSFRAFNYGPVALFRPAVIMLLLVICYQVIFYIMPKISRRKLH